MIQADSELLSLIRDEEAESTKCTYSSKKGRLCITNGWYSDPRLSIHNELGNEIH